MSDSHSHSRTGNSPPTSEAELRELLRAAGPRPAVPAAELERLRGVARRELERLAAGRKRTGHTLRSPGRLALAASLLLVLAAGWWWIRRPAPVASATVAEVELLRGEVRWSSIREAPALGVGLPSGVVITTAVDDEEVSAVSLRLAGGQSVRIDAGSRVRLASAQRLELEEGAVYLDSGEAGSRGALEVATDLGTVRDVGTRFEVRLAGRGEIGLEIRVREGEVALTRNGESHHAEGGEQLIVDLYGAVDRAAVEPFGESWQWALDAAPAPEIEGMQLSEFVRWVCRETGWTAQYAGVETEEEASSISLHGSIEGLTPMEALEVVFSGSGVGYRVDDGVLVIDSSG